MSVSKILGSARRRSTWFHIVAVTAATFATLGLAPAHADVAPKEKTIDYQDLDLSREQDVQRLYARLQRAARTVCAPVNGRSQYERSQFRQCFNESLAKAVNEVNVTQLTKLHGTADAQRIAQGR